MRMDGGCTSCRHPAPGSGFFAWRLPPGGRPGRRRGLLIPTEGDLARIDPEVRKGVSAVWCHDRRGRRHDRDVGLARSLARSPLSAPGRRIPVTRTAVRVSPVPGSRSTSRAWARTRGRAFSRAMPDRPHSRTMGSGWRSWPRTGSSCGCSRTAARSPSRPEKSCRRSRLRRCGSRAERSNSSRTAPSPKSSRQDPAAGRENGLEPLSR